MAPGCAGEVEAPAPSSPAVEGVRATGRRVTLGVASPGGVQAGRVDADGEGVAELSPTEIELVRASLGRILRDHEQLGRRFYDDLFRRAPDLRPHFPDDLRSQQVKLVHLLEVVVHGLQDPEVVAGELARLGRFHLSIGVDPNAFDRLTAALVDVIAEIDPECGTVTRRSWSTTLALLVAGMRAGTAVTGAEPVG